MANTTISQLTTQLNDPADSALFAAEQGSTQKTTKEAITKKIKTDVVLQKSASVPVSANSITLDVEKNSIFHVLVDSPVNTINVSNLSSTHDTNIEINFQQNSTGGYAINFNGITIIWQQAPTGLNTQADMLSTVRLKHRAGTAFWVGVFDGSVALNGQTGGNNGGVNNPPVVSNYIPNGTAIEQQPYTYTIPANTFTDPDGDTLTYSASYSSWLSFDPVTRILTGTPTASGTQSVTITATDTSGASASDSFNIVISAVAGTNTAPSAINTIPDSSIVAGTFFNYTFPTNIFYDANGDVLTYTAITPNWLTFTPVSRTFSGTPVDTDAGSSVIVVTATDPEGATATTQFNIAVTTQQTANNAPIVSNPIGNFTIVEGQAFNYTMPSNTFYDQDGDTLVYTSSASGWVNFDSITRVFTGTPGAGDVGSHNIIVTATDPSFASVNVSFTVTVTAQSAQNNAPVVSNPIVNQTATEGELFTYTFPVNTFTDPDGDPITYTSNVSGWLSFDSPSRTFTGTPTAGLGGSQLAVTVTASDLAGLTATSTFALIIANPSVQTGAFKGINSNWASGYDTPNYFSNLARYTEKWENHTAGDTISTNQHKGRLITDNATDEYRAVISHPSYDRPAGNYSVRWDGNGQIGFGNSLNQSFQAFTSNKNFTLNMPAFNSLYVWFKGTDLTKLEFILPGEAAAYDSGNEWSAEYLSFFSTLNCKVFRAMNLMSASDIPATDFADLAKKTDISYQENVPIDVLCDFAQRTGSHIWYNTPARSTDASVIAQAQQFATHKPATIKIYLEGLGNEVWNTGASWAGNTRWIECGNCPKYVVTANSVTGNIEFTNHGLNTGDKVRMWVTNDYGWEVAGKALPWQARTADAIPVEVVNANEFKIKHKTTNTVLILDSRYPKFLLAKDSEVTTNLNLNYTNRCVEIWDIFKQYINSADIEFILAGQSNNAWHTEQRLLNLPDLNTINKFALAPYYTAVFWSFGINVAGTTATPRRYCSEGNTQWGQVKLVAAIYASSATPTQQDVELGVGAISHEAIDSPGESSLYTEMSIVNGLTVNATYKCHFLLIDKYGVTTTMVIPFTQTDQVIYEFDSPANMAAREIAEISGKSMVRYNEHIAKLQGIPPTLYEGGPHYHHKMPDEVLDWFSNTYWKSTEAENLYKNYLSILAGLGYEDIVIYKDMSTSRFGLAFDQTGVATDSRAKAYKSFTGDIPIINVPTLVTNAITVGSSVNTGDTLVDYAAFTTSTLPVAYSILLGDTDGMFTITTDGKLKAGDMSKYDFNLDSTRFILIKIDNGTHYTAMTQEFTLGGGGGSSGGTQSAPLDLTNLPTGSSQYGLETVTTSGNAYVFDMDGSNTSAAITVNNWLPQVANGDSISITLTIDVLSTKVGGIVKARFKDAVGTITEVLVGLNDPVVPVTITYTNTSGVAVTPNFELHTTDTTFATVANISNITYTA